MWNSQLPLLLLLFCLLAESFGMLLEEDEREAAAGSWPPNCVRVSVASLYSGFHRRAINGAQTWLASSEEMLVWVLASCLLLPWDPDDADPQGSWMEAD